MVLRLARLKGPSAPAIASRTLPASALLRGSVASPSPLGGAARLGLTSGFCSGADSSSANMSSRLANKKPASTPMAHPLALPFEVAFEPPALPVTSVVSEAAALSSWGVDLLVLAAPEDAFKTEAEVTTITSSSLQQLDGQLGGALADIVAAGGFDGKPGSQSKVVRVCCAGGPKYVGLIGLGKADKLSTTAEWGQSTYQTLGGGVATLAKANKSASVGVAFVDVTPAGKVALTQVVAGALLGGYESLRFKTKPPPTASKLARLEVLMPGLSEADAKEGLARAEALARGTTITRYLVEAPPNICTPKHMADCARHVAAASPDVLSLQVYDKAQCMEWGMGLFIGVAEASELPPQFIHLKYSPPGGATKKVAIIGKGLTFDSGGYNLKAGAGSLIELMKFDMGGAGAVLGAARIVAETKPANVEVHFIIAACENMVAGKGLRPGDVLISASGKTVEVNNTDAEGRLTLADAMWFAQEKAGVTAMLDVATLTGACIVALGTEVAGLFTPNDAVAESVLAAAKTSGEKIWRMPWEASYFDSLKSAIADMRNTGARYGGAISAALFLKQFVNEGVDWAHLDIAGPVWNEKLNLPTGYGAAMLAEWAASQGAAAPADKA